ncbi:MAG: hypothetical protein WAU59_14750 [Rhodoplanes sp.]
MPVITRRIKPLLIKMKGVQPAILAGIDVAGHPSRTGWEKLSDRIGPIIGIEDNGADGA